MPNYFELYDMQLTLQPDAEQVKAKFYELSRKYHPDRYARAGAEQLDEAMTMAALNNQAYKVLADADATLAYVLQLSGVLKEDEKYNLPPAFLMEMMDLNEAVSDWEMEPQNEAAKTQAIQMLQAALDEWQQAYDPLLEQLSLSDTDALIKIKDMYFRKKYLLRIQERLSTFASR